MTDTIAAAVIASIGGIVTGILVYLSSRRANRDSSEAKLREWTDDLMTKVQQLSEQVDRLRDEAHLVADELRTVRYEAFRENDIIAYRAWLASRPDVLRRSEQ